MADLGVASWKVVAAGLAVGVIVSGCSLLEPYPPLGTESTREACTNDQDDDLNGQRDCDDLACREFCHETTDARCTNGRDDDHDDVADCDDPDCDGRCPERSTATCGDARDQDGDGLVDHADPSCWPYGTTTEHRCAGVDAFDWEAGVGPGSWISTGEPLLYVPDPLGRFAHDVIRAPSRYDPVSNRTEDFSSELASPVASTGAMTGLTATVSVAGAGSGPFALRFVPTAAPPPGAPTSIQAVVAGAYVEISLRVDGRLIYSIDPEPWVFPTGWVDITLEVGADAIDVRVVRPDDTVVHATRWAHGAVLADGAAYRFLVSAWSGTYLGAASMHRSALVPCGHRVPSLETPTDARGRVIAAARGEGLTCVIIQSAAEPSLRSLRSTDGTEFAVGETLASSFSTTGGPVSWPCASITWDPTQGGFVGFARNYDGFTPALAYLVRSPDCRTWTTTELAQDGPWPTCGDYAVVERQGRWEHELWAVSEVTDGLSLTRTWSSAPFDEVTAAPARDAPLVVGGGSFADGAHVLAFPRELVVGSPLEGTYALRVVDRSTGRAERWTTVDPSRIEGSCDAAEIFGPVPFVDPLMAGRAGVAHPCFDLAGAGSAVVIRDIAVEQP